MGGPGSLQRRGRDAPTPDAFIGQVFIQSLSQRPAGQQLPIGACNVPASVGKPESVEPDRRGSHPGPEGRSLYRTVG